MVVLLFLLSYRMCRRMHGKGNKRIFISLRRGIILVPDTEHFQRKKACRRQGNCTGCFVCCTLLCRCNIYKDRHSCWNRKEPCSSFGNVFCVLAALLIGEWLVLPVQSIKRFINSLCNKRSIRHLFLSYVSSYRWFFVAHKLFHLSENILQNIVTVATVVSSICGMAFNIV